MVPRLAGVAALLVAACIAGAQAKTVRIEFPSEGSREVWFQDKGAEGVPSDRTPVSGKAVSLDVPEDSEGLTVFVREVGSGNVASKSLADVTKSGSWKVAASDETHTYSIVFLVAHKGEPVSTAVVKLKAGETERQTLLTPADMGMAGFFVVPYGDVEVTVEYKSEGEDRSLPAQVFEVKPGMGESGPITVAIEDAVETVAPEAEATAVPESPEGEEAAETKEDTPKTHWFSTLLNMVIGLAVVGGIAYAVWRYVKANPDKTSDALQKAGVAMPGDDPVASAPAKPTGPPKQILLDDAAPTPAAAPVAAGPVVRNPRLVLADGSVHMVQDGEQSVGRDEAREIALTGETSVSRTHAKIVRTGNETTIEDAGSTNGTFVNGQKVEGPRRLNPGDAVQFGSVQVRYEE